MNEPHPAVLGMIQGLKVDIKYQRRHFRLWHFASVSQDRLTSVIRATADVKRASLERRNDPERSLIIRWSSLALVGIVHLEVMANGRASLDEAAFAVSYRPARSFSKEDGTMSRKARMIGISTALAACLFGATAGFSEDAPPPRMRGTIDQVNGNTVTVKTRSGSASTVQLKDGGPVVAVTKGSMSDIQQNSFVGIAAMAQPDGTIKAMEVSVFAEPLRGTAEGHYPWDLTPGSTMTNAAVTQQVTKQEGNTLTLKYKDGEKTIVVPSDAVVVNLIPGDKADLKPGAKVFVPVWAKTSDGTWEAAVVLVGRDGITPPM